MPQETTNSAVIPGEMNLARWLFNPFIRIAGGQALAIGLTVIVASGLVAAAGGVHFDGLLDFHPGYRVSFWVPVVEGLVNWSVSSVLLVLVSLLVAPRTVRLVDIAGTQALARAPLLLAALACVPAPVRDANAEAVAAVVDGRMVTPTVATLVAGLLAGTCAIWMVWLMWKAFSVSCNQRGGRAVAIFVAAIIAGETATKFLLAGLLGGSAAVGAQGGS
ncbi:MAG: hypothetical protein OXG04_15625 [Acidobacteria bacterium]|nr:hypothetical protein [Acidobacteriota bacterium]